MIELKGYSSSLNLIGAFQHWNGEKRSAGKVFLPMAVDARGPYSAVDRAGARLVCSSPRVLASALDWFIDAKGEQRPSNLLVSNCQELKVVCHE